MAPFKRKLYTKDNLNQAITAVKNGMSKKSASKKYKIPRSTLIAKIAGKYSNKNSGPGTVLTEAEEARIVKCFSTWISNDKITLII